EERQPAIPGVADAAASGSEPTVLGFATDAGADAGAQAAALDPAEIEVALEPPDKGAGLQFKAQRAATHRALGLGAAAREHTRPVRITPPVAAVETDIEAGPTERRNVNRCLV